MCAAALLRDLSEFASRRHIFLHGWLYIVMCHVYLQSIKRYEEYLAVLELFGSKLCVDGTASECSVLHV